MQTTRRSQDDCWISFKEMTTEDISVWFPIFITEFLLMLMINAITIIAFARIRHLRKRSTYLIINLTAADLLVGAVAGPLHVYLKLKQNQYFSWPRFTTWAVKLTFIISSPMNLSLISLDRLHATLFPFRHCLIRKWSYFRIIIGSWFITLLFGSLMAGLYLNGPYSSFAYARTSFDVVNLLVLAVSYTVIFVNVYRRPHFQNSSTLQAERKLSTTLSIVTGVSVLTILPWAIYKSLPQHIKEKQTYMSSVDLHNTLAVISFANSIVNPFVYAIRMQEFRKAIRNLVSRQRQRRQTTTVQKRAHRLPDAKLWTPTGKLQTREWKRRRGGKTHSFRRLKCL